MGVGALYRYETNAPAVYPSGSLAAMAGDFTSGPWLRDKSFLGYPTNGLTKLVDGVVGFEYDAGCWLGRIVLDRTQTGTTTTANQKISFQLEFVGFTRLVVGTNPLSVLKENIPRYQYLREQTTTPSRFSQYD